MEKEFKAVMIGCAHVHVLEVARYCYEHKRVNLVAFADTKNKKENLERNAIYTRRWNAAYIESEFSLKRYEDYTEMLDDIKPDLALITSENALHAEIVENCAKRGIAVSVEKPMAISLSEGLKMARSVKKYNTLLMVNWPIAWRKYYYKLKQLIDEGVVGDVIRIRHFAGNTGAVGIGAKHRGVPDFAEEMPDVEKSQLWWFQSQWGGGAMLDFCGYGCLATHWLIGRPALSAFGMKCNTSSKWGDAEDNAGMLVMYDDCFATIEGTWTAPGVAVPPGPEVFGTKGVIRCERDGDAVNLRHFDMYGKSREIEKMDFEEQPNNIAEAFINYMDGRPLPSMVQLETNLNALAILDAGVRSANSGKQELVQNSSWCIE